MVSEFRKKKFLFVFNFFDADKNGSIEKKDFEQTVENIAKARGLAPSDAKYKEIQTTLNTVWEKLQKQGDTDNDGQVTADEWIAMCEQFAKAPASVEWQNLYRKFIFSLQDASNDGSVDEGEFVSVHVSFGHNKDESKAAFQKLAKGKSSISWAEFQGLWKEYFVTEDVNAPGNYIFGKTNF